MGNGKMDFRTLLELGQKSVPRFLDEGARTRVEESHRRLLRQLESSKGEVYGLHTGYGSNVLSARSADRWRETQQDLLSYLQVGRGPTLPESVVRRALRLQAMKVARGVSGIHPETYDRLIALASSDSLPAVPCFGSLGASGDLIPMAHAVAPIFEGDGPRAPRDVIGLVNTNSMMASLAIERLAQLEELVMSAHEVTAQAMVAVRADTDPVSDVVVELRGEVGYRRASQIIRSSLQAFSAERAQGETLAGDSAKKWLQPRYSLRCAPMVLGNAWELLEFARSRIVTEALAVADNPVVAEVDGDPKAFHAGLFYAAGLASASDAMNDVAGKVGEILDRQVLILMDPSLSEGLPENLGTPGAGHLKGIHQLISALNQQLRGFSVPSRSMSFSCEGNNQDIVPCAMTALNQLGLALGVLEDVVRGASFVSARAVALRAGREVPEALRLQNWARWAPNEVASHVPRAERRAA